MKLFKVGFQNELLVDFRLSFFPFLLMGGSIIVFS